jgi:hypothetical protein
MYRLLSGCFLAAIALMCGCIDLNQQARCTSDDQCRYERVCGEDGFCQAPAHVAQPADPDPDPPTPQPHITATPAEITFERVQDGDPSWRRAWRTLEIQNTGRLLLDIVSVELEGDSAFELSDAQDIPSELAPGDSFEMRVWYYTDASEPVSARVIVGSNDPRGDFVVPLSADPKPPCVQVAPVDNLVFRPDEANERLVEHVTLTNCADESSLAIREVRLEVDAGGGFFVPRNELPGRLPEHSALIAPGESAVIPVVYTGNSFAWNEGELVIETNVPERRIIRMLLLRETSQNDCPIARAGARTSDGVPFVASIRAQVGMTVELSARNSVDPDGEVVDYQWAVVSRPNGSREVLTPNGEQRDARLRIDQPGQYLVELQVWDDAGASSCGGAARVTVIAQ